MNKDLHISMLLDFYRGLLTDKQIDALDLYYNQDLSLAEISQHLGITRQGVRDNIKRGEKQLEDYEAQLGLAAKFTKITSHCKHIKDEINWISSQSLQNDLSDSLKNISKDITEIESII